MKLIGYISYYITDEIVIKNIINVTQSQYRRLLYPIWLGFVFRGHEIHHCRFCVFICIVLLPLPLYTTFGTSVGSIVLFEILKEN